MAKDSDLIIATLNQWAADAQNVVDGWTSGSTWSAQKDATLKEVIRRFGVLCSNSADILGHYGFKE